MIIANKKQFTNKNSSVEINSFLYNYINKLTCFDMIEAWQLSSANIYIINRLLIMINNNHIYYFESRFYNYYYYEE